MNQMERFQLKQACTYFMVLAEEELGQRLGKYLFNIRVSLYQEQKDWWIKRTDEETQTFRDYIRAAFPGNELLENSSFEHIDWVSQQVYDGLMEEYHNG